MLRLAAKIGFKNRSITTVVSTNATRVTKRIRDEFQMGPFVLLQTYGKLYDSIKN